ncbi:CBS-domain-containing membrane protein [Paenibacillus endophyticus]|uniref:CBS-domain-containing membrane protein n=1 Tax=Paenibacillus endophyticus TaxID=1294268 RepID=A0A7W5C2W6_9BACL|nr:CBS-domain-containing membrane protein [Paenibacillus endophyticus]
MNKVDEAGFWLKMRSKGRSPLKVVPRNALIGAIGGFTAIAVLALLSELTASAWMMAPFGATCVLAFGLWDAPLSQPRNIIGGHVISTLVGLLCLHFFGQSIWVMAAAVGLSIGLMMLSKTTHPPAGADPLVVILSGSSWTFLLTPVLIGSVLIVVMALLINNMDKKRKYPTFWF